MHIVGAATEATGLDSPGGVYSKRACSPSPERLADLNPAHSSTRRGAPRRTFSASANLCHDPEPMVGR
jgi:hypothetical protein